MDDELPVYRAEAAAEQARQEQMIEEYNAAKQAQGDEREAKRAANRQIADKCVPSGPLSVQAEWIKWRLLSQLILTWEETMYDLRLTLLT